MSIERIDHDLCNGCGACLNSCPMDVIRIEELFGKAIIKYPEDCMCCNYCELACPKQAIYVSPVKCAPVTVAW